MVPQDDFGQPKYAWYIGVQYYSKRLLTFEEDRFAAIAGFASKCEQEGLTSGRYVAGLWENELLLGLTWQINGGVMSSTIHSAVSNEIPTVTSDENTTVSSRAPSWSWASVNREVAWAAVYTSRFFLTEIASIDCNEIKLSNWSKTARAVKGQLPITAPFLPLPKTFWDQANSRLEAASETGWADTIENQTLIAELISPFLRLVPAQSEHIDSAPIVGDASESTPAAQSLTWRSISIRMDYSQEFYRQKKTFMIELCNLEVPGTFPMEPTGFSTYFLLLEAVSHEEGAVPAAYRRVGLITASRSLKHDADLALALKVTGNPAQPLIDRAEVVSIILV
jgi:hypothetical protein